MTIPLDFKYIVINLFAIPFLPHCVDDTTGKLDIIYSIVCDNNVYSYWNNWSQLA